MMPLDNGGVQVVEMIHPKRGIGIRWGGAVLVILIDESGEQIHPGELDGAFLTAIVNAANWAISQGYDMPGRPR